MRDSMLESFKIIRNFSPMPTANTQKKQPPRGLPGINQLFTPHIPSAGGAPPKRPSTPTTIKPPEKIARKVAVKRTALSGRDSIFEGAQVAELSISEIGTRAGKNTRHLNPAKVIAYCHSIAKYGVISPIVLDQNYALIAGLHRRGSCMILGAPRAERSKVWTAMFGRAPDDNTLNVIHEISDRISRFLDPERIPVRIYGFDSVKEPQIAMEIEVAENEHRHQYTDGEIREIILDLLKAGYTYNPKGGKPKEGEKPLGPALKEIFESSRRTVSRILANMFGEEYDKERVEEEVTPKPIRDTYRAIGRALALPAITKDPKLESIRGRLESIQAELQELYPDMQKPNTKK
jgi:ParB family chromosome partitioning protein